MKRTTNILLAGSLAALTLAALPSCGDKKSDSTSASNTAVDSKSQTMNLELTGLA